MMIKIFKEVFMLTRSLKFFLFTLMLVAALTMFGCGDDGDPGPAGPPGPAGKDAVAPAIPASAVEPETCVICHGSVDQTEHQSIYNMYTDPSTLTLTIDSVVSQPLGTVPETYDTTVTFTITQNGVPFTLADVNALDDDNISFHTMVYDSDAGTVGSEALGVVSYIAFPNDTIEAGDNPGQFTISETGLAFPSDTGDAQVFGYIDKNKLDVEVYTDHLTMYGDIASSGVAVADGYFDTYSSPANVEGCQKCHGTPYYKHGHIAPVVDGLKNFSSCKSCHMDTRGSYLAGTQRIVTNPLGYATKAPLGPDDQDYQLKSTLMNDVHVSHSMEFGYPQNMANCATCHSGPEPEQQKLDIIQADENFTLETCKSCHPVTSTVDDGEEAIHEEAAPSLYAIWGEAQGAGFHTGIDLETVQCNSCHSAGNLFGAPLFGKLMPGYDPVIYADNIGTRYSDIFKAIIDDGATFADNILTISFHVTEDEGLNPTDFHKEDIVPYLMIGLYGYDTKDFIGSHASRDENGVRDLEGEISEPLSNPYFTIDQAPGDGTWVVKADLSRWADQIGGTIKKAEIMVRPALRDPALGIEPRSQQPYPHALNAPSRTFDFMTNDFVPDGPNDPGFFGNSIADVNGCNKCHDALATTFHTADRGGNVTVCRYCHEPSSGGSHLEMQSRAIDSYAHAIHSFQGFDIGDVDFADPIQAVKWTIDTEHFFPNFTVKNCEACHTKESVTPGKYAVPDDFHSLAAVLSASDYPLDGKVRNIGELPSYVTGPGYRSCGGCHRADFIKEDEAGKLLSLNGHATDMGYLVKADENPWESVVETIQGFFFR
jgi:OmcA/MtrC family decaheme c-type cytochrome